MRSGLRRRASLPGHWFYLTNATRVAFFTHVFVWFFARLLSSKRLSCCVALCWALRRSALLREAAEYRKTTRMYCEIAIHVCAFKQNHKNTHTDSTQHTRTQAPLNPHTITDVFAHVMAYVFVFHSCWHTNSQTHTRTLECTHLLLTWHNVIFFVQLTHLQH